MTDVRDYLLTIDNDKAGAAAIAQGTAASMIL
jgi:hypothetical protein